MRWLALLCCLATALAQTHRGAIAGSVLDQDSAVPNAPIEAKNIQTGGIHTATSAANGSFSITDLPPGRYEVRIAVEGFEKEETTVQAAQTASVTFHFQPDYQLGTLGDGDIYSRIARLNKRPPITGPTPRTAAGKPDLSGVWRAPNTIGSDEPELLPAAQQLLNSRFANNALDSPAVRCMPDAILRLTPIFKILPTSSVRMVVIEAETPGYYQVFLDGRPHPPTSIPPGMAIPSVNGMATRWPSTPSASTIAAGRPSMARPSQTSCT